MIFNFKKPQNRLEGGRNPRIMEKAIKKGQTDDVLVTCPKCKKQMENTEYVSCRGVCVYCGFHGRLAARQRIAYIADAGSFVEVDADMLSTNPLNFPEYERKKEAAKIASKENDAVVCGVCTIKGVRTGIFIMEPYFMMGSMGVVVGEKITRVFEHALKENLPVVGFTVSGGARMQEGILSLMQMAKISGAVKRHSDAGGLYICVLTDPTTGGVTASFAMAGDVTIAEPGALVGFAGPRVIEQTIRKKLPEGFQEASFLLEKGFVDDIVARRNQHGYIARVLRLHNYKVAGGA